MSVCGFFVCLEPSTSSEKVYDWSNFKKNKKNETPKYFSNSFRKQKPKGETRMQRWITRESMRVNPFSLCLRVIVNKKLLNIVKTTSSVLSVVLLIYFNNYNTSDQFIDFLLIINLYFFDKQRSLEVKFWTTIKVSSKKNFRKKC